MPIIALDEIPVSVGQCIHCPCWTTDAPPRHCDCSCHYEEKEAEENPDNDGYDDDDETCSECGYYDCICTDDDEEDEDG